MDPQAFLNQFLAEQLAEQIAGSPSFEITGGGGDARRARRGLSQSDVQRLMQAYPDKADKIREMYLGGVQLPPVREV